MVFEKIMNLSKTSNRIVGIRGFEDYTNLEGLAPLFSLHVMILCIWKNNVDYK